MTDCTGGASGDIGLYVDDQGVAGTRVRFSDNVALSYLGIGLSNPLSAGSHTITFGMTCSGADTVNGSGGVTASTTGAVLIGN